MEPKHDKLVLKYDLASHIALLKALQKPIEYKMIDLRHESFIEDAAKRIPFLGKLLPNAAKLKDLSEIIVKVGDRINDASSPGNKGSINIFQASEVALAAINLVSIPLMYLAYYLVYRKKDRVPITFSNNARLLYSALGLGLAIVALTFPVAAPFIALAMTSTGLGIASYVLGKTLNERFTLGREKKALNSEILRQESDMQSIQLQAQQLEESLKTTQDEAQITTLLQETAVLRERYDWQKNSIHGLKTQELRLNKKIEVLGTLHVLDKTVGVALASYTLISIAVIFLVPPVGLWMLAGGAIAGGVYGLGRLATPLMQSLGNWVGTLFSKPLEQQPIGDLGSINDLTPDKVSSLTNENTVEESLTKKRTSKQDSYAQVLVQCNDGTVEQLDEKPQEPEEEPAPSHSLKTESRKPLTKVNNEQAKENIKQEGAAETSRITPP